jgi:hypothetical protein
MYRPRAKPTARFIQMEPSRRWHILVGSRVMTEDRVTGVPAAQRAAGSCEGGRRACGEDTFPARAAGRYQDYLAAIRARGEDPAVYADYLEAFAHGMPPHGGFAIGLERWTGRLTQAENIREVTLFPRDRHRLTP